MTEPALTEEVAELTETEDAKVRSLSADAWRDLRHNPLFWISGALILVFVTMAIAPGLFTNTDPRATNLAEARSAPTSDNWFGRDVQGYDLYARCVYGARASILVGVFATLGTMVIGVLTGLLAGYSRGWIDGLTSRIAEVFFGIPLILGAIIILTSLQGDDDSYLWIIFQVVLGLVVLGWPSIFRLMRASVLQVTPHDYIAAARALGAGPVPGGALAHPAQRDRPGDRGLHDQPRRLHRRGGGPVLPRDRPAAAHHLVGRDDRLRPLGAVLGTPRAAVPRPVPEPHRARLHHAR